MKKEETKIEKPEKTPDPRMDSISSDSIDNAHASGDGAIRRSEKSLEEIENDDNTTTQPSVPY